jgi:hypothetical protein
MEDSAAPLNCPERDDAEADVVWYYFRPHTAFNQYHLHNDNVLPIYRQVGVILRTISVLNILLFSG